MLNLLNQFCATISKPISSITGDGILTFFGAIVGVIGTFLIAKNQMKKEMKKEDKDRKAEKEREAEKQLPILRVSKSYGYIDFEEENPEFNIKLVNVGETAALDVHVRAYTFIARLFYENKIEPLKLQRFVDDYFSVLMREETQIIQLISSAGKPGVTKNNIWPLNVDNFKNSWDNPHFIPIFLEVDYSDKNSKKYRIEQMFHIDWKGCKFEDGSHVMVNANYHIVDGIMLNEEMVEEYNNLFKNYKKEEGFSSISMN